MNGFSFLLFLLLLSTVSRAHGQLIYVNSAVYKFIVGLSVPIEVEAPGRSLGWLINFQGLYRTPDNITYFQPYKIVQRRALSNVLDRSIVYKILEPFFSRLGLPGVDCIQRLICDSARTQFITEEPFLGKILQILFTPTRNEPSTYQKAHQLGRMNHTQCSQHFNCSFSPFIDTILPYW